MAKIHLSKKHSKSKEEIDELVGKLEEDVCSELQLSSRRSGNKVLFKRSGVDGALTMAEQRIDIEVKLGIMNSLFAPQIESALRKKLDEYLG